MSAIYDTFTRADNASSLGTADSGQAWANTQGTWGIASNEARLFTSAGNDQNVATIDSGESNGEVSVQITTSMSGLDLGVVFRCVDASNYMLGVFNSSAMILYKQVAGSFISLASTGGLTIANGDVLSIDFTGSSLTFKQNGVTRVTATDGTFSTATRVGIRQYITTGARFDNFSFAGPVTDIDGAITSAATTAGALSTQIALAGSPTSSGSVLGSITTAISLDSAVTASATAAGDLRPQINFVGGLAASGAVSGDLATSIANAANVGATGVIVGSLSTEIRMSGSVTSGGLIAGTLAVTAPGTTAFSAMFILP
jgi:hypothetical protein